METGRSLKKPDKNGPLSGSTSVMLDGPQMQRGRWVVASFWDRIESDCLLLLGLSWAMNFSRIDCDVGCITCESTFKT